MKSLLNHNIIRLIPAFVWMSVIFYFSSRSTAGIGDNEISRVLILKSFHIIEYAILAILIFFALNKFNYTLFLAYLYALSDEIHQSFIPGRTAKFTDTLIDFGGILLGLLIIRLLLNLIFVKKYLLASKNKLN